MIYTSYFGAMKKLSYNQIPVAICATIPDGIKCLHYKKLAPSYDNLMTFKSDGNWNNFASRYKEETLNKLRPINTIQEIKEMIGQVHLGKDIVLLCYEKNSSECHRSLVAEWLTDNGILTKELVL